MGDDSCINSRTLYDIVWTCLTTIFACIWVSVHPNMPPQPKEIPRPHNESAFSGSWRDYYVARIWDATSALRRRLKTMVVALIAPEIIVGFAARQWFAARRFSTEHGVSLTHGFFYSMGGFVDTEGYVIVDEKQLTPAIISAIKAIPEAAIQDKSKRDGLAKLLAVTQILRIVAQSLARWNQHLAITSLELATVAYAVVTTFMWFFWMNKPLDTHTAIQVCDKTSAENYDSAQGGLHVRTDTNQTIKSRSSWDAIDRFRGMLGGYRNYDIFELKNVPAFFSPPQYWPLLENTAFRIQCAVAIGFGAIHCIAWNTEFPSVVEKWMWRSSAVAVTGVPVAFLVIRDNDILESSPDWLDDVFIILALLGLPLYVIARLFLLVLPFTALRSLEPTVFIEVDWGKFIPHL